jgi:uncharacterized membrane protein YsdA (DUF1294 family)
MATIDYYFLVYLAIVSFVSIILTVTDKLRAKKRKYRVPEAVMFLFALLGGSAVMYLTMCIIRHKTQKNGFVFGIPLIFIVQCACVYFMYTH